MDRFAVRIMIVLFALVYGSNPASAERPTRARLVQCGSDSCLRLSGYRPDAGMIVRIGAHDLAVEGDKAWQATVPLNIARTWPITQNDALSVALVDPQAGTERVETVAVPPGSLGSRTEIAFLVITAH